MHVAEQYAKGGITGTLVPAC